MAKFEPGTESQINHYYTDDETFRLINAVATVIGRVTMEYVPQNLWYLGGSHAPSERVESDNRLSGLSQVAHEGPPGV